MNDTTTETTDEDTRPLARLDALLGARQDGLLEGAEAAELEALLAASEQARARARAFEAVDTRLRSFAAEPLSSARLEANLSSLRVRLDAAARPAPVIPLRRRRRRVVAGWAGAALTLAAGLLAALLLLPRDPESIGDPIESVVSLEDADLEVIEELELLEFLAARERGAEVPRG